MKYQWRGAAASALVVCSLLAGGCATTGGARSGDLQKADGGPFPYEMLTLDNGMRVVSLEDHSSPVAAVQLWYHVGSKDETTDRRGFAHMFEHMMFRGTDRLEPLAHTNYVDRFGGDVNAYTAFDQTVYVQEIPANQLEMVMWLEAERMAFLKVDEEGFQTEREVVKEEYRQGREAPYGTVVDQLVPRIFNGGTYSWTPIGDMDTLNAANHDDLQKFWETYYTPNNATLVVVGDVKHEDVQAMAEKYFGWIPRYEDKPALAAPPAPINTEPVVIKLKEKKGPAPIVALGWRTVPNGHPDEVALALMGDILGGGEASRLYQRLVVEDELAMVAMGGGQSLEADGVFGAGAILSPVGAKKEKVMEALREEIEKMRNEGATQQELDNAKLKAMAGSIEGRRTVASKAGILGSAAVLMNDIDYVNREEEMIEAVTLADVQRVAKEYLAPEHEIEVRVEPSLIGMLMGKDEVEESAKPISLEGKSFASIEGPAGKPGLDKLRPADLGTEPPIHPVQTSLPNYATSEQVLANGLKVVVVPNHEVPTVNFSLRNFYGAYSDPEGAPGTASFAAGMITQGTTKHSYKELTELLDANAIDIGAHVGSDSSSVSGGCTTDKMDLTMELMAEAMLHPSFPKTEFNRLMGQTKSGKMIEEKSPQFLVDRELKKQVFGNHPYGRSADATLDELKDVNIDGMKAWWSKHMRPDKSILYVSGDVDASKAFELAQKYLGEWKAEGAAPEYTIPEVPSARPTTIYLVDAPADQAQIQLGQALPGFNRNHPGYFPTRLVSQYWGGGFSSRLIKVIRTQKGLTYSAGGGVSADRFSGQFIAATFTKNKSTAETVQTLIDEVRNLLNNPPDAKETEFSKGALTGGFALSRELPESMVEDLWMMESENLPKDYYQQYLAGVAGATPDDVTGNLKKLIDPDKLAIVVVGPADQLKEGLEKIAPVEVIHPEKDRKVAKS